MPILFFGSNRGPGVGSRFCVTCFLFVFMFCLAPCRAQQKSADAAAPPEILVTDDGFLAITIPTGWVRADGPGVAYLVPAATSQNPSVCIYVSAAAVGPREESKDMDAYIQADIANFKRQYKGAVVQQEQPLALPEMKLQAPVVTFRSGEKRNSFERVIYIPDTARVWTLVLSAKDEPSFSASLGALRDFAQSYRGTITVAPN